MQVYIYVLRTSIHFEPFPQRPPQLTSLMVLVDISMAEEAALGDIQFIEGCRS